MSQEKVLKNLELNIEYLNSNFLNKFGPYLENSIDNLGALKPGMDSNDRVEFYQYLRSMNYSLNEYSKKLSKTKKDIKHVLDKIMLDKQDEFSIDP